MRRSGSAAFLGYNINIYIYSLIHFLRECLPSELPLLKVCLGDIDAYAWGPSRKFRLRVLGTLVNCYSFMGYILGL